MENILDRDFNKAIDSTQASIIRGKMGQVKGNKYIQDLNNKANNRNHCSY